MSLVAISRTRTPRYATRSAKPDATEHITIVDALKKRDGLKPALKSVEHVIESGQWLVDYLNIPAELLREKEEQVLSLLNRTSK